MPIAEGNRVIQNRANSGRMIQSIANSGRIIFRAGGVSSVDWSANVWTGSVDSISQSGIVSFTNGNGTVSITSTHTRNSGTNARDVTINYTVTQTGTIFAGTSFNDSTVLSQPGTGVALVRNEYSDWSNDGDVYDVEVGSEVCAAFGTYNLIETAASEEFQDEQATASCRTTGTASQDQVRTCEANGGCDGPYERTIPVTLTDTFRTATDTRVSTTRNPLFVALFTFADASRLSSLDATISATTGDISLTGTTPAGITPNWVFALGRNQDPSFGTVTTARPRDIGVTISGTVPDSASYRDRNQPFGVSGTITRTQPARFVTPPALSVSIRYSNTFGAQRVVVGDGETAFVPDIIGTYTISVKVDADVSVSITANGVTQLSSQTYSASSGGTNHEVTATRDGAQASIRFTVSGARGEEEQ